MTETAGLPNVFVRGQRVYLRSVGEGDITNVIRWLNDPETRRYLSRSFPATEVEERQFVQSMATPANGPAHIPLIVCDAQTNEAIGCTGMHQIDWVHRKCELGIFIGDAKRRGSGLGQEAFELIIEYAIQTLNLHRVYLTVFAFNDRGIRCYERIGFKREGIDRQAYLADGEYHDVLRYGLLAPEWRARQTQQHS